MEYLYPGGLPKAMTFSYDDGQVYDRRLVKLFDEAGFKATFHLNSGNLGKRGFVTPEEVGTLYQNHEVACHGVTTATPADDAGGMAARGLAGPPGTGSADRAYRAGHELRVWRVYARRG